MNLHCFQKRICQGSAVQGLKNSFYGCVFLSSLMSMLNEFLSFFTINTIIKVKKVAKIRNQYNQAPHLTQDTTWESDKNRIKH